MEPSSRIQKIAPLRVPTIVLWESQVVAGVDRMTLSGMKLKAMIPLNPRDLIFVLTVFCIDSI